MKTPIAIYFEGDQKDLLPGLTILEAEGRFRMAAHGTPVRLERWDKASLEIERHAGGAVIRYRDRVHAFRGLGLLLQAGFSGRKLRRQEDVHFNTNGVMFDVSQGNSVINIEHLRQFLRQSAWIGMNRLLLYMEDSYEVAEWPLFGYMRGRYTQEDLRQIDDYADALGIEVIPCIQTLAHLIDALKWPCFAGMRDDEDVLLVGEPKVYQFIEDMIVAASKPFRTREIHIGMDEAYRLGQGEYLLKNGPRDKFSLMIDHLERVVQITQKLQLKPMIWSDMFFRAASGNYYDTSAIGSRTLEGNLRRQLRLVYWDYYSDDEQHYRDFIAIHRSLGGEPVFAGGIWTWTSFAPNQAKTYATTRAALRTCRELALRDVFVTVWGDDTTECPVDAILAGMVLFAEYGFGKEPDSKRLDAQIRFLTGASLNNMMTLTRFDEVPGVPKGNPRNFNASKILMWQDPLYGLYDADIKGLKLAAHYAGLADDLRGAARGTGLFAPIFRFYVRLAEVLELKSELGLRIHDAYHTGRCNDLAMIVGQTLPLLARRVRALRLAHRKIWFARNKPFGWETYDLRYGNLLERLDTVKYRLTEYLDGQLDRLPELDAKRQPIHDRPVRREINCFAKIASASRFSFYTTTPHSRERVI